MRLGQISVAFVPDSTGLAYTFLSAPITNNHPPQKKTKNIYLFFSNISVRNTVILQRTMGSLREMPDSNSGLVPHEYSIVCIVRKQWASTIHII